MPAPNFVVYFMLCKDCWNGQSLGKRIFHLQVHDFKTGKVASPLKCILRNFCYTIWIVEFIYFLCKKDGVRVGDWLTNARVVSEILPETKEYRKKAVITLAIAAFLFLLMSLRIAYVFTHFPVTM